MKKLILNKRKQRLFQTDPPVEVAEYFQVLLFVHATSFHQFVSSCVGIICSGFVSSHLESALPRTLFTAALFNELKLISVPVGMCPLFPFTTSNSHMVLFPTLS